MSGQIPYNCRLNKPIGFHNTALSQTGAVCTLRHGVCFALYERGNARRECYLEAIVIIELT